jgi:cyclopropane fatty-acyl-phospholipid synthase-like methyltransferase
VKQFRAGKDYIPYDLSFDLIYSIDTIYYLTDIELKQFFRQCATKLVTNGKFIIQFIETDLKLDSNTNKNHNFDINFLSNYVTHRIHSERNSPIRHLIANEVIAIAEQSNLRLVGSKRMLQSYDLNETEIRVDKYLIFSNQ